MATLQLGRLLGAYCTGSGSCAHLTPVSVSLGISSLLPWPYTLMYLQKGHPCSQQGCLLVLYIFNKSSPKFIVM